MGKIIMLSTSYQDMHIQNINFSFEIWKREKESDLAHGIDFYKMGQGDNFREMNYPHFEIQFCEFTTGSTVLHKNFKEFYKNLHIRKGSDQANYYCITSAISSHEEAVFYAKVFTVGILWSLLNNGEKFDKVFPDIIGNLNANNKRLQLNDTCITLCGVT